MRSYISSNLDEFSQSIRCTMEDYNVGLEDAIVILAEYIVASGLDVQYLGPIEGVA